MSKREIKSCKREIKSLGIGLQVKTFLNVPGWYYLPCKMKTNFFLELNSPVTEPSSSIWKLVFLIME